jgi:hypothetical protein
LELRVDKRLEKQRRRDEFFERIMHRLPRPIAAVVVGLLLGWINGGAVAFSIIFFAFWGGGVTDGVMTFALLAGVIVGVPAFLFGAALYLWVGDRP